MDISKDLMASLRGRFAVPGSTSDHGEPAWTELHARLSAAHAAAGELARGQLNQAAGGFGLWQVAGGNTSRLVNPTGLADGKRAQCNESAIAGKTMTGGRGQ